MLGTLLIVSGPSGSGKTTLCRRAEKNGLSSYSISCTTRNPRDGEVDGTDYHFLSQEDFAKKISDGDFLEYATVHGNSYGTLRSQVIEALQSGKNVVMDIDVQGADSIRASDNAIICQSYADLYIHIPSAELEARLRGRQTDSEEVIQLRLKNASDEDAQLNKYQFILTSSDRESDYSSFCALLKALSMRLASQ